MEILLVLLVCAFVEERFEFQTIGIVEHPIIRHVELELVICMTN